LAVKHTIAVDWLEINLKAKAPEIFDIESCHVTSSQKTAFIRIGNGNKFYKNHMEIIHEDKKLGTMFCNSRSPRLMEPDNIQLKVENNKLYELGWLDSLKSVMAESELNYKSCTRLDIALDGGNYFEVFEQWNRGEVNKVGRAKMLAYFTGKRKVEGFRIGKGKSKKHLICYNKTDEMKRTNKWYIGDFWKRAGLMEYEKVERVEMSMRNEENKKIFGMDFNSLDNFEHLASLMQTHCKKFFEFVSTGTQKNITRAKRIEPIDWNSIGGQLLEKNSTRDTSEIWAGKVSCKKLYEIYYITKKNYYYDIAFEIAINIEGIEWFNNSIPLWTKNLEIKLGKNRDGEIKNTWVNNFQTYHMNEQLVLFEKEKVERKTFTEQNEDNF